MSDRQPRNRRERRAAERAARKAGQPYTPPKPGFPADQDLAPNDVSVASHIEPRHTADDAQRIVQGIRNAYAVQARTDEVGCDVVVIAVPAGKGRPFLEGLELALKMGGQLRGEAELPGTEGLA